MSWRIVVISKRAKLDLQLGYMVVRSEEVTKIVLSEISTILFCLHLHVKSYQMGILHNWGFFMIICSISLILRLI